MLYVDMTASVRSTKGKGPMRRLRAEGMTPAVVYGAGGEALNLQLETKSLMADLLALYRRNAVVSLKIDNGTEKNVVVGEVQTDPVKDTLVHVDFCEIDLEAERDFSVSIRYQGIAKGVDLGGVLFIQQAEIVLSGKPLDIPDVCEVDISGLNIGESIRCGKIAIPDKVVLVTDPKAMAVSVVKPGEKIGDEDEDEDGVEAVEEVAEAEAAPAE